MSEKKTFKKIKSLIAAAYAEAWENGFESGVDQTSQSYDNGFDAGALAERERIKSIFDMNIKWALENNKGSEVIFFSKAKEIIEPIEVDYSDEAYFRNLEADGF